MDAERRRQLAALYEGVFGEPPPSERGRPMTAKNKLPKVPTYRKPKAAKADAPAADAAPDLSMIAEGLRPLARPLADLAFLATNAVDHPDGQIEELKELLAARGQLEPLIVNRRPSPPVVIGGNGRLRAMLALNWTHAACVAVDLSDEEAEQVALELNRASDGRNWNAAKLDAALERIKSAKVVLSPRVAEMMEKLKRERGLRPPAAPPAPKADAPAPPQEQACPACGHRWYVSQ